MYPLTLYAIASPGVGGIEAGAYRYLPKSHSLQPLPSGFGFKTGPGGTASYAADETRATSRAWYDKDEAEEEELDPEDPNLRVQRDKVRTPRLDLACRTYQGSTAST